MKAMKAMKSAANGRSVRAKETKAKQAMTVKKPMKARAPKAPNVKQKPALKSRSGKSNWQAWRRQENQVEPRVEPIRIQNALAEQSDVEETQPNTKSTQTPFWIKRLRRARDREDLQQHGFDDMLSDSSQPL